ncbi:MAG: hypothetical protein PUJ30_08920 [Bacteroidales bacterium]|nr:hypothetical protein [Bacteroidales bacterium]
MGCKTALTYHRFDTYFTYSRDAVTAPTRHQTAVARKMKKVVLVILKK